VENEREQEFLAWWCSYAVKTSYANQVDVRAAARDAWFAGRAAFAEMF
jgi:hypothetical protein